MTCELIKMTYPICNISKVTHCDIKSGLIYAYQASVETADGSPRPSVALGSETDFGSTLPQMEMEAPDVSPHEEIAEALQLALREVAFDINTSSNIRFDAALYDYIMGVIKINDENISDILSLDTRLVLILKYAFDNIVDLSKVHRAHMIEAKRVARELINRYITAP